MDLGPPDSVRFVANVASVAQSWIVLIPSEHLVARLP